MLYFAPMGSVESLKYQLSMVHVHHLWELPYLITLCVRKYMNNFIQIIKFTQICKQACTCMFFRGHTKLQYFHTPYKNCKKMSCEHKVLT